MARSVATIDKQPIETGLRDRIIAEARRQFLAHGFRGVTMSDLAGQLAMSKKTLYATFADKAELLEAVVLDKFQSVERDLEELIADADTEALTTLAEVLACLQRHMAEIQPSFLRDIERLSPQTFDLVKRRRTEVIQRYFGRLLDRGRRGGVIRNDIPAPVVMEILQGAVQGMMSPPKLAELGMTPKSGISAIVSVIFEGLITRKARAKR